MNMINKIGLFFLALVFSLFSLGQAIDANTLLDRAINYHDPEGNWKTYNANFTVEMRTPKASKRVSAIQINLPEQFFSVSATQDTVVTSYTIDKAVCSMAYNGKVLDSMQAIEQKMSCNRANLYKNYYTYLYGLPMKLKDAGANLSDTVELKTFNGKPYLVLKVNYDEGVGSDVWYFYFNPETYAMEVYQFFKTDKNGKEKPESGEYILMSDEALITGIKIPKVRAWYYNKDDKYLGTDTLIEN